MFGERRDAFPKLTLDNTRVTSPAANCYNCIAWAAGENFRWWWPTAPEGYWPPGIKRAETRKSFIEAFGTVGFVVCKDGDLDPEVEKIALFGKGPPDFETPTHAARQLESGEWTSKLGPLQDIEHANAQDVSGPAYGDVICYMQRPRPTTR